MDDDLDAELVGRARRGDPSAAPFLVSCYGERLLGYARSHAPDLSDADREQIVELAIEAGVRAIDRFDPEKGSLQAWFRGQIRFQTLGWRRANPTTSALDVDVQESPRTEPVDPAVVDALRRSIARLEIDDQRVLAYRSVERLAYRELGLRLEIKEDTARQRHRRALERLRKHASSEPALQRYTEEVK